MNGPALGLPLSAIDIAARSAASMLKAGCSDDRSQRGRPWRAWQAVRWGGAVVLPLNSIEVRNFRGLNDLSIGTLGRVNLFVGKNNVGKTSLLEAVQIWATRGSVRTLWDILDSRAEVSRRDSLDGTTVELLFNRSGVEDGLRHMSVGPVGRPDARVTLGLG